MSLVLNGWPPKNLGQVWLTIGNFDGVHLGHQALISRLRQEASQHQALALVITFWPHPRLVFNPRAANFLLDSLEEKTAKLQALKPDLILNLPFTKEFAALDARAFFALLNQHMLLQGLIVGQDFALGHDRAGSSALIKTLCQAAGAAFLSFPPVKLDGQRVSSGLIRKAIAAGQIEKANRFLGQPYRVFSKVREGKHLGSRLGFPTANQILEPSKLLPKFGVYATRASIRGKTYMGVTGVGVRPTVEEAGKPNVETWILDFDGNIYGEDLEVEFIHYLRGEEKFASIEAMIAQIKQDAQSAREVLTHAP